MKTGRWTAKEANELMVMRDERKLSWRIIAAHFDRSKASCIMAHHHRITKRRLAEQRGQRVKAMVAEFNKYGRLETNWQREAMAGKRARKVTAAPQQDCRKNPPAPLRSLAAITTDRLIIDAELRSRIEVSGITAGLLGDPPPGRSALDERRAGIVRGPASMQGIRPAMQITLPGQKPET
jgi:hypothetical protein